MTTMTPAALNEFTAMTANTLPGWSYRRDLSTDGCGEMYHAAVLTRDEDGLQITLQQVRHGSSKGRIEVSLSYRPEAWKDANGDTHDHHIGMGVQYPKATVKADTCPALVAKAITKRLVPKCEDLHAEGVRLATNYQAGLDATAAKSKGLNLSPEHKGTSYSREWGGYDESGSRVKVKTYGRGEFTVEVADATEDQVRQILAILGHEV